MTIDHAYRLKTAMIAFCSLLLTASLSPVCSQAAFPPAHYPSAPHPRLWLTAERMDFLLAERAASTPRWQRFVHAAEGWYAINLDPQYLLICGGAPLGIAHTALMYKITGESRWLARTLDLLHATELQHATEYYYWTQNDAYLALGYDWLYHDLTATQRADWLDRIVQYDDNLWADAHDGGLGVYTAIDSDRTIKGGANHLMLGCAVYGDTPRALDMLNRAWYLWVHGNGYNGQSDPSRIPLSVRDFIRYAIGGVFFTGMHYAQDTDLMGVLEYFETFRTACGYEVHQDEPDLSPFIPNTIRSLLDLTDPTLTFLHNNGDWQDSNRLSEQNFFSRLLIGLAWEADRGGYPDAAATARGYLDALEGRPGGLRHTDPFGDLFFARAESDPDHPHTNPYTAGLPTVRFCPGEDYLFGRTDWGSQATMVAFTGDGCIPVDHQGEDLGNLTLFHRGEYLTRTATGYRDFMDHAFVHNVPSIANGRDHGSPYFDCGREVRGRIDRRREGNASPVFAYAMLQADCQWNAGDHDWPYPGQPGSDGIRPVETYRRHFFWSGDHAVVFDRVRFKHPTAFAYRLRGLNTEAPTVQDRTVSQLGELGNARLLHRTLLPENCVFTLKSEAQMWGPGGENPLAAYQVFNSERKWQVLITPPPAGRLNLLHVLQMGPASLSGFDTLQTLQDAENTGVRIGPWSTVFSAEEALRTRVAYTIQDATLPLHHLAGDLVPGTYQVLTAGARIGAGHAGFNDNTLFFETTGSCSQLSLEIVRSENTDFNADGHPDLLWRNSVTGDTAVWHLDGAGIESAAFLGCVAPVWEVVATADFNLDGHTDLFWRNTATGDNAVWLLDGVTVTGSIALGTVPTAWILAAATDLNADGKTDLLWRNAVSGTLSAWFLDGLAVTGSASPGSVAPEWELAAAADFNRDGRPDLLWRHSVGGHLSIWYLDGLTVTGAAALQSVAIDWEVATVADFNGDANADLLWRHRATGDNAFWLLDGITVLGTAAVQSVPANWRICN